MFSPMRRMALAAAVMLMCCNGRARPAEGQARPRGADGPGRREQRLPKFTLKDQEGRERSLDEFLKKGKVALVFYRSADW